jgi:pyruvate-formate lyase-activating enzyme
MNQNPCEEKPSIEPSMTVLDIVFQFRQTESVFKQYDEKAGVCLCCQALFEPLEEVADKYNLDLKQLIADLTTAVTEG